MKPKRIFKKVLSLTLVSVLSLSFGTTALATTSAHDNTEFQEPLTTILHETDSLVAKIVHPALSPFSDDDYSPSPIILVQGKSQHFAAHISEIDQYDVVVIWASAEDIFDASLNYCIENKLNNFYLYDILNSMISSRKYAAVAWSNRFISANMYRIVSSNIGFYPLYISITTTGVRARSQTAYMGWTAFALVHPGQTDYSVATTVSGPFAQINDIVTVMNVSYGIMTPIGNLAGTTFFINPFLF